MVDKSFTDRDIDCLVEIITEGIQFVKEKVNETMDAVENRVNWWNELSKQGYVSLDNKAFLECSYINKV